MSSDPNAPRTAETRADPERFVCYVARLLADNNCENVIALDLRGISQVTDFFVIASGTSDRQIRSVADELKRLATSQGEEITGKSGEDSAQWMVIDLFNTVVHLFEPNLRSYYDLESLWADGKRVDWQSRTTPGQFARV